VASGEWRVASGEWRVTRGEGYRTVCCAMWVVPYNPTIPQSYNPVLAKILHLYQPLIHAVLRHELFMGALFCNGSGLNNNNLIGLLDGA